MQRSRLAAKAEKTAWAMNLVFDELQAGKSAKDIAKRHNISHNLVLNHINELRQSLTRQPNFIPPKGAYCWNAKKAGKAIELLSFAKQAIVGEIALPKRGAKKPRAITPRIQQAMALLKRNPSQSNITISLKTGACEHTISKLRHVLEQTEEIRAASRSERIRVSQRKPERKTFVLSKQKRQKILLQLVPRIAKVAESIYFRNKGLFDRLQIDEIKLAEKIAEKLDWRLQVYDPKRIGGDKKTKLDRYIGYHLSRLRLDEVRIAAQRAKGIKTFSLEAEIGTVNDGERLKLKDVVPAAQKAKVGQDGIELLEKMSERLKLDLRQKAVMFGMAAGMTNKSMGKILGYSEAQISIIAKRLKPRVAVALKEERA